MPSPNPTEKINALRELVKEEMATLKADIRTLQTELDRANIPQIRERLAVAEQHVGFIQQKLEELKQVPVLENRVNRIEKLLEEMKQFAVIENRLTQLEDQKKLGDTRLFQFILLFVGGIITLSVQIILLFLKK